MANFNIGDRVRIASPGSNLNGMEGTIWNISRPPSLVERLFEGCNKHRWSTQAIAMGIHPKETAYLVDIDGLGRGDMLGAWGFPCYWLRPLVDPKADAFIASVKSWGPLREPTFADMVAAALRSIGVKP